MKPCHSRQLALPSVVLFAAIALCSMPLVVHAQDQKPLVFIFGVPVWQEFNPSVGNFQSLIPPSPVQETDFAASHHCAFWAALLSAH